MPRQEDIPVAANVLGTIGTVFWCVQLVPQIWHNWRYKKTEGLPQLMMLLWAISSVAFGAYAVVQNFNIPIQVQPQAWGTLSLVTWAQILIYTHKWSISKATTTASVLFLLFGGIEVLLILTLRGPYNRGVEWPMVLIGSLAALFLALGILPPYPELWKRRGRVVGINFAFLGMDALGAIFSLLAIVAQRTFDILGGVIYIIVIILEAGIFASHLIWLYRTRALRKQAQLAEIEFDDLPEADARRFQIRRRRRGEGRGEVEGAEEERAEEERVEEGRVGGREGAEEERVREREGVEEEREGTERVSKEETKRESEREGEGESGWRGIVVEAGSETKTGTRTETEIELDIEAGTSAKTRGLGS